MSFSLGRVFFAVGLLGANCAAAQDRPTPSSLAKPQSTRPLTEVERLLGRPASIDMLWRVLERDLVYGQFEEAERHLDELLANKDLSAKTLLEIREKYGPGVLMRLQRVPALADKAKPLVEMLTQGSRAQALDPSRLRYFVGKLDESPSERAYAIDQLRLSGPDAIPYLVEAFLDRRVDEKSLLRGFLAMPQSSWPAVAALLDSQNPELMSLALDVLTKLAEPAAAEFIDFHTGNPASTQDLREKAAKTIAYLEGSSVDQIAHPVRRLVDTARKYDEHRSKLGLPDDVVRLWSWVDHNVAAEEMTVVQAEETLGLRAARQALLLDSEDRDAKVVFLKLALEPETIRIGIEQPLSASTEGSAEIAVAAGHELLSSVLDDALRDGRSALALAAVRALAPIAPPATTYSVTSSSPLVRALDFPNARVRLSAALAAIEAHPEQSFSQADRLVSILAQSLDTSSRPRAVVVDADLPRATAIGQILTQMGYDPLVATTGRDGTKAATETSLVELTVIDSAIHSGDLRSTLDVLSADARCAGVPTLVVTREPPSAELEQILQRYRHTILVPAFNGVEAWKRALSLALTDKASLPMNDEERSRYRQNALGALVRIARGEFHYLNPDPAIPSLAKLLRDESLAPQAAEALGYLPSAPVQEYLLTAALDSSLSVSTRMAAARALARNVTRGGSALAQGQRDQLIQALSAEEEPDLRAQLAAAVGAIDPQGESATPRITKYRPSAKPREPVTPPASSTEASAPSEDPASDAVPTDAPAEPAAEESP